MTSNPAIFKKPSNGGSTDYNDTPNFRGSQSLNAKGLYEKIANTRLCRMARPSSALSTTNRSTTMAS